jgi:hypothetical protein
VNQINIATTSGQSCCYADNVYSCYLILKLFYSIAVLSKDFLQRRNQHALVEAITDLLRRLFKTDWAI